MPYALCPMPYALCPMHVGYLMLLRKAIYDSPPLLALEKTGATNPTNKAMGTAIRVTSGFSALSWQTWQDLFWVR